MRNRSLNLAMLAPSDPTGKIMTIVDYDAPRRSAVEEPDAFEVLGTPKVTVASELDTADPVEAFELPGAELFDEELSVSVVPMRADEFRCTRCFLVHHRSQRVSIGAGQDICRDCA